MTSDLLILALLGFAFLALFGVAEWLYHKRGVSAEVTRKIVHSGTGILTLLFPLLLDQFWQVALLCGSFLILLLASLRWRLLPSINAVERDTLGSILYPITIAVLFLFYQHAEADAARHLAPLVYFYLPVSIMALCDPLAAAVGQRLAVRHPERSGRKTWEGSTAFFAGALLLSGATQLLFPGKTTPPLQAAMLTILTALTTTLAERWSQRGWDNFTIPVTAAAVLWVL